MISRAEVENFYRCAVLGLEWLDRADPCQRRFGADAEARWTAFHGEMDEAVRLDLLCRDAAVPHPVAFAARVIFNLHALSSDEPFGPEWPGTNPVSAARWLHQRVETPPDPAAILSAAATRWSLTPGRILDRGGKSVALKEVGPADRLVLAGAAAIQSILPLFIGRPNLDAVDQCVLVSAQPGERQLFGLFLLLASGPTGSRSKPRLLAPDQDVSAIGLNRCDGLLLDEHIAEPTRAAALRLTEPFA